MEDRDPTPHRDLETKIRMCFTARRVTREMLRSMDAEYLEGLKVHRYQQKQKSKKLEDPDEGGGQVGRQACLTELAR